ncbi:hypothetical protein MK489_10480 [Myxococcota bacterium]|nr:hypothetical protein [Myxococcota bacterium]
MLYPLIASVLCLTAIDHWTTYLCLRAPVEGWSIVEANPIADWLFQALGLVPGLAVDSVVTLIAVAFLVQTHRVPHPVRVAFFAGVAVWTAHAVVNNFHALSVMGLSPTGG